jgi:glycosyltransferase involved in cell wall biosynthesis
VNCTVVIPAHNEATHIEGAVGNFLAALSRDARKTVGEVLVVENGSTDGTLPTIHRLAARYPGLVRPLAIPRASYGAAIRHGILESSGAAVAILECDFLDARFLESALSLIRRSDARFVVASKRHPASADRRPRIRRLMTRGFNVLLRLLVGYPGGDTHGLKVIDGPLARELCAIAVTTDEVFQTELVLLAWRLGHTIYEVPIALSEVRPTPIRLGRRVPKVIPILWELRRSLRRLPPRPPGSGHPVRRVDSGASRLDGAPDDG